mmetsp:Transcript_58841/g.140320  ORF Transcript_58841/g.140320 Transcript_58841/m.140320 type:complete len:514 (-) Transcript_58841:182-1723(-)
MSKPAGSRRTEAGSRGTARQSQRTQDVLRSLTDLASLLGGAAETQRRQERATTPPARYRSHRAGGDIWSEPARTGHRESSAGGLHRALSASALSDSACHRHTQARSRTHGGYDAGAVSTRAAPSRQARHVTGREDLEDFWREQLQGSREERQPDVGRHSQPLDLAIPSLPPGGEGLDKVVERRVVQEKDIVVEVPQIHYHTICNEVPRVELKEVQRRIEVPEVHWVEDVRLLPKQVVEEEAVEVPQITIREVLDPVFKEVSEVSEEVVEVPMPVPRIERIVERPRVDIREKCHFVLGHCDIRQSERTVEVPHVLEVPQPVLVPRVQTRVVQKDVVVPQIESIKKIVQRPEEQLVHHSVEIPVIHAHKNVIYKPVWVDEDSSAAADLRQSGLGFAPGPADVDESVWQRYEEAQVYITTLEQQLEELQAELQHRQSQLTALSEQLQLQREANEEAALKVHNMHTSCPPQMYSPARKLTIARGFASEPSHKVSRQSLSRENLEWSFGSPGDVCGRQ